MSDLSYNLILISELIVFAGLLVGTFVIQYKIYKMNKNEKMN